MMTSNILLKTSKCPWNMTTGPASPGLVIELAVTMQQGEAADAAAAQPFSSPRTQARDDWHTTHSEGGAAHGAAGEGSATSSSNLIKRFPSLNDMTASLAPKEASPPPDAFVMVESEPNDCGTECHETIFCDAAGRDDEAPTSVSDCIMCDGGNASDDDGDCDALGCVSATGPSDRVEQTPLWESRQRAPEIADAKRKKDEHLVLHPY